MMDGWVGIAGLLLTALGAVAGAALQHGVSKEKVRNLETRMSAAEARQELMREALARGDTSFAELRLALNNFGSTLVDIKGDIEKLLSR